MVHVIPCNLDARHCHGGVSIRNTKQINIFSGASRSHSYCSGGFGFGFGGGFWSMLGSGLGLGLGMSLFNGLFGGGGLFGGLFGGGGLFGNLFGGSQQAGGYYPGAGCTCGNSGHRSTIDTSYIPGQYSYLGIRTRKPEKTEETEKTKETEETKTTKETEETEEAEEKKKTEETAGTVKDILDGKKITTDPNELNKLLTTENIDELLKNINKLTVEQKTTIITGLKEILKGLINSETGNYKFTTDFGKLKQLELLCALDPSIVVDVAKNEGPNVQQRYIHGSISNVKQDNDKKISLTIDNSNVSGEYGLCYDFEAVDGTNNQFKIKNISDGVKGENKGKASDYNFASDYKDAPYTIDASTGLMKINTSPRVRKK